MLVLDAESGKLIQQIDGIERPHAILYRSDVDRLYVTDGGDGSVKVFLPGDPLDSFILNN